MTDDIPFKEYFYKLDEMPHLPVSDGDSFDYEIEYFKPDANNKEQKFQELKEYIGKLTLGDERIVYGPFNDNKTGFWSDEKNARIARETFKNNKYIQFNVINWFADLISNAINPQKIPITKRTSDELVAYKNWVESVINEYQSAVFNENKLKTLPNNNINNIK